MEGQGLAMGRNSANTIPEKFWLTHFPTSNPPLYVNFHSVQSLTSHLVFAISAAALGSSFQHGYNTGVVNAPQELVQRFISEAHSERFHDLIYNTSTNSSSTELNTDVGTVNLIYSIMVSIFCIGGMIGALLTGYVAEKFGRKGGLLWNNVFVFLAAALMGFSKMCRSYEMLIMGRFFIGFNAGQQKLSVNYQWIRAFFRSPLIVHHRPPPSPSPHDHSQPLLQLCSLAFTNWALTSP